MKGWVYVISNKAMPGLVKVGYSMKDPTLRAEELNHTGSPHPYIVDYEALVEEPFSIEQKVHSHLKNHREGKEWFRCTSEEAIAAIQAIVGSSAQIENFKQADRERAIAIRRQQETEEQTRKTAAEQQQKRKTEIEQKSRDIYNQYEPLLKDMLPNKSFLPWVFICVFPFVTVGLGFYLKGNGAKGAMIPFDYVSLLMISAFVSFLIAGFIGFITGHLDGNLESSGKAKEKPEYKALIAERDRKIAALENTERYDRVIEDV